MCSVIDLSKWRHAPRSLSHPAGISLPFEEPGHVGLLIPEIREAIERGTHCADLIEGLRGAVRRGDRVLVLGSGLGVLSSRIARTPGVERVIAIEPKPALAAYIDQVHRVNGVPWIESLNAVPVPHGRGHLPLFMRHDVHASSLDPEDGPWEQVVLVPKVNLNLILAEERISLIVAESPALLAPLLADAQLGPVNRLLVGADSATEASVDQDPLTVVLAERGFAARWVGTALVLAREHANEEPTKRLAGAADWLAQQGALVRATLSGLAKSAGRVSCRAGKRRRATHRSRSRTRFATTGGRANA